MEGGIRTGGSRRRLWTPIAVLGWSIALLLTTAAPAKDTSYKGEIFDSQGKVEFHLERDKGALWVMDFHANGLPYTCPDGSAKTTHFGIAHMKIKHREFEGYTAFGDFRGDEYAEVEGRLRRHGRARGIVSYQNGFDGVGLCKGEADWGAHS